MQYLYLPVTSDRPKEVRVIDFYENATDEFKIQTRDNGGDWEYAETVEGMVEDAIAIALNLFKPKPIEEPLNFQQIKQQLKENNGSIKVVIPFDIDSLLIDELTNGIIDDIVLDKTLRNNAVWLDNVLFNIIGCSPELDTLIIEVEASVSDETGFLED